MRGVPEALRPLGHRPLHPAQGHCLQQGELRPVLPEQRQGQRQRRWRAAPVHHQHQEAEHIGPDLRQEEHGQQGAHAAASFAAAARPGGPLRGRGGFLDAEEEGFVSVDQLESGGRHKAEHQAGEDGYDDVSGGE